LFQPGADCTITWAIKLNLYNTAIFGQYRQAAYLFQKGLGYENMGDIQLSSTSHTPCAFPEISGYLELTIRQIT